MTETTKRCSKCSEKKPLSEFLVDKRSRDSHGSWCKRCDCARSKKWRTEHKEHCRARSRAYYARHHTSHSYDAQAREYARKYKQEHAAELRQAEKKWREEHPEQYRETNRVCSARRYARKLGAKGSHTVGQWLAVLARYGSRCIACGATEDIQQDHVVPLTSGGSDYINNIQPLCRRCNILKKGRYVDYRPESYWADWT